MTVLRETAGHSAWFTPARNVTGSAVRCWFLCFPHAGSGAAAYLGWSNLLPPGTALRVAQLPGRERRLHEPPFHDARSLVRALLPAVQALADRPIVIFGHSLGALVAFELAVAMRNAGLEPPVHLFLSGRQAPQVPYQGRELASLSDGDLVTALRDLGGTPEVVLGDPGLLARLAPVLRADLAMNERYEYVPGEPLTAPITAFAACGDPRVPADGVGLWDGHTSGRFELVQFTGGHFALLEQPEVLMRQVRALNWGVSW